MSTPNAHDPRADLPPEILELLRKMDEVFLSIPADQRERAVRALIDEANQLAARYEQMTARIPEVFKKIDEDLNPPR